MMMFDMVRGGEAVAQVVRLGNGKCVVSWPTSTIVHDSLEDAKAVHITHMGGRGERTEFLARWSDGPEFTRGATDAYQDRCEGCWFASVTDNYNRPIDDPVAPPSWAKDPESYMAGYETQCREMFGDGWRKDAARWIAQQSSASRSLADGVIES